MRKKQKLHRKMCNSAQISVHTVIKSTHSFFKINHGLWLRQKTVSWFQAKTMISISQNIPHQSIIKIWFFSNLVGEEGPRILGVKDPRVYFLETLSALLAFFRFLQCLFVMYPTHFFQWNLNPLLIISAFLSLNIFLLFTWTLEPLDPWPLTRRKRLRCACTLWNHIRSIGNDPHILP